MVPNDAMQIHINNFQFVQVNFSMPAANAIKYTNTTLVSLSICKKAKDKYLYAWLPRIISTVKHKQIGSIAVNINLLSINALFSGSIRVGNNDGLTISRMPAKEVHVIPWIAPSAAAYGKPPSVIRYLLKAMRR